MAEPAAMMQKVNESGRGDSDAALTLGLLRARELAVVGVDEGEEELATVTVFWLAGAASSVSSLLVSSGSNSPVEDADVPVK
jgi:hypothetical protein